VPFFDAPIDSYPQPAAGNIRFTMPRSPVTTPQTGSRRRQSIGVLIGVVVTALTLVASEAGLLARFEWTLFDLRSRWFAHYTPPPSPDVWHINIDDNAIDNVGRWPWHREKLAIVVDELRRVGASVIAFDVLFSNPQEPRFVPADPTAATTQAVRKDDDAILAEAIGRAERVLIPFHTPRDELTDPLSRRIVDALVHQPYQDAADVAAALNLTDAEAARLAGQFSTLLERALRVRLHRLAEAGRLPPFDDCRAAILGAIPPDVRDAPHLRILRDQHAEMRAAIHVRGHGSIPSNRPDDPVIVIPPALTIAEATDLFGVVNYDADADGKSRSVPLWISVNGRRYPMFALASAAAHFGLTLDDLEVTDRATVMHNVPADGGGTRTIRIPMVRQRAGDRWDFDRDRAMISWPTATSRWEFLYDPAEMEPRQMLPIGVLIEAGDARAALQLNNHMADGALSAIVDHKMMAGLVPSTLVAEYKQIITQLAGDDLTAARRRDLADRRHAIRGEVLETARFIFQDFQGLGDLAGEERALRDMLTIQAPRLELAMTEADRGRDVLDDAEQRLRQLRGRICIIGWTATGSIADFVPTSLNERTPGPIVHGAVLNSILTGHFLDRGPRWLDSLALAVTGLFATLIAVRFAPVSALLITAGVIVTAFIVNGVLLFDYMNVAVAAAGPTLAGGLAWAAVTVHRLVLEQRERARITAQFKNYVSGDLVDLIVENPDRIKQGRHELTCMFSDIAGFTTVSEQLGPEQTITLLNEYLRAMTQRIMAGRGTVNKYLGDGIMAFWGAPIDDETHALNCCQSVLNCIRSMNDLQQREQFKDLPRLFMRVGVCTGPMMVGDCGAPPDRSDYTVIGDSVNLAARLESSNKQFDTQILLSQRTHELVADQMLARPVGRIRVVGKADFETVYELLSDRESATEQQQRLADVTDAAVNAFIDGDFENAAAKFEQLAQQFGRTKLIDLYLDHCRRYVSEGRPDDFRGELVLTEK